MNLVANNITCEVGDSIILRNFNYSFPENSLIGILTSPREKTELILKSLCGLYDLNSGEVTFGNEIINPIHDKDLRSIRKKLSFVYRSGGLLSNLTVIENLLLPLDFHYPEKTSNEKMEIITDYISSFEIAKSILEKRPAQLAVHEHKLILIIRGFVTFPKIIFYEEPTDGLDIRSRILVIREILRRRKEKKCLQIYSTHFENKLMKFSDSLIVIEEGKLIESGSITELSDSENLSTKSLLEDYLMSNENEA
jgi:ABC-type transporter Mla maintaining outer membrane lipid asymmetry ATPase subunit MlaF